MSSDAGKEDLFRWQAWFQRSDEPIYLLNRSRRLLFANRAWEKATGLLLKEVRGRPCRRRSRSVLTDKTEAILAALSPTPEAIQGTPCQVRRLLPTIARESRWVELAFLPISAGEKLLGTIGLVKVLPQPAVPSAQPMPEKWLTLRDRLRRAISDWESDVPAMLRVIEQFRLASTQPGLPITLVGPRGAGKLHAARSIHQLSERRQHFFACLDCDRLPPRAATEALFSFLRANLPPVILLKEPSNLPREVQATLLETMESENAAWIMAAFRDDPLEQVRAGKLLEELHYRLSTLVIRLPSLAERRTDLPRLANGFLHQTASLLSKKPPTLALEAMQVLSHHSWPGNLHELKQVLWMADEQSRGVIEARHLPLYLTTAPTRSGRTLPLDEILEKVERRLLETALRLCQGHKQKASEMLGIWKARLLRRMEALGLEGRGE